MVISSLGAAGPGACPSRPGPEAAVRPLPESTPAEPAVSTLDAEL